MTRCKICDCKLHSGDLCRRCKDEQEWLNTRDYFCKRCGKHLPGATDEGYCAECRKSAKSYTGPKDCPVCGRELTKNGHCHGCRLKKLQQERKTMETKHNPFCKQCGLRAARENSSLCQSCAIKNGKNRKKEERRQLAKEKPTTSPTTEKACAECGAVGKIASRGLCWRCYNDLGIRLRYSVKHPEAGVNKANAAKKAIESEGHYPPPITETAAATIHASPAPEPKPVKWELPWSEEKILKTAVKRYGNTRQISKAAEECAELAAAISRFNANEGDYKEIISELADVEIMCRQLRMIYGDAEIDAARTEKLKRLEKRLKS